MIWFEPVDADKQYRSDGQDHDGLSESQHSDVPCSALPSIASWSKNKYIKARPWLRFSIGIDNGLAEVEGFKVR